MHRISIRTLLSRDSSTLEVVVNRSRLKKQAGPARCALSDTRFKQQDAATTDTQHSIQQVPGCFLKMNLTVVEQDQRENSP